MTKGIWIKILVSIIILSLLTILNYTNTYAVGNIFSDGKSFLSKGNSIEDTIDTSKIKSTSDYIYNTLLAIGIVAAVIVAMILGIQFMWASADEKAKVKEAIVPFVVGCAVVFGAFTIWKVAVNIGNKAEDTIVSTGGSTEDSTDDSTDDSTGYTKDEKGTLYCGSCNNELSVREQRNGKCFNCNKFIEGI